MLRVHRQFIVLRYTASHAVSRKRAETLYRVALESANLIKVGLVTTAAMLAVWVLALVGTTYTAEAKDSLPENGKIAFISYLDPAHALYTVEPDGSNPRQLLNDTDMVVDSAVWSPDGTKIAFSHTRGPSGFSRISVMNADGSDLRHLYTTTIRSPPEPTWSPDGTKVAFHSALPGRGMDIFVMDPDGSNLNNLTGVGNWRGGGLAPAFSPDGKQICFLRDTGMTNPPTGLYVMDADGSDPSVYIKVDPEILPRDIQFRCTWSPDGTKIAFSLSPEHEVFVINADGGRFSQGTISKYTNLTSNSASDEVPDWSPDGKKIAFASDRDGDYDIYTMDADGSDVAQVTNLPGNEYSPDWQPLPRTVHQPPTGGPSLLLVAIALLFSGGVMFYAGLKRRV